MANDNDDTEDNSSDYSNTDSNESESTDDLFDRMLQEEYGEKDDADSDDAAPPKSKKAKRKVESVVDDEDSDDSVNDSNDDEVESVVDDEDSDEVESEVKSRSKSKQNVVRRLQASEREALALRNEVKELRTKLSTSGTPTFQSSGDLLDDLKEMAMTQLGIKDINDPKLRARLMELGGDMLAELHADSDDVEVQQRLSKREQLRRDREIQRQIDELKQNNSAKDRELQAQRGLSVMTDHLRTTKAEESFPYLYAAEDDVPNTVLDGIRILVESGHRIDDSNAEDTINFVCDRLNKEHLTRLSRLEALKIKKSGQNPQNRTINDETTRGARKDGQHVRQKERGGRSVTASGVGRRQAPAKQKALNSEELFERMLAEELADRKRQSARRR